MLRNPVPGVARFIDPPNGRDFHSRWLDAQIQSWHFVVDPSKGSPSYSLNRDASAGTDVPSAWRR